MPIKVVKLIKRVRPYLLGEEVGLESTIADRYIKLGVAIPLGVKSPQKSKPQGKKTPPNKKPPRATTSSGQTSPGVVPNS